MSLLTLIQDAASIVGLPRPAAVTSDQGTTTQQLLALANREGVALSKRSDWTALVVGTSFVTVADETQGTIEALAPGFRRIVNQTMWNRTQQEPLGGPLTPQDWQTLRASVVTGPYGDYRIRRGVFEIYPAPTAGETAAFEYVTDLWCQSAAGTDQDRWASDDDVAKIDEELMLLGIIWRWKQTKGFDYGEDKLIYETEVMDAIARDGGARTMSLNEADAEYLPTIRAPIGSWNL